MKNDDEIMNVIVDVYKKIRKQELEHNIGMIRKVAEDVNKYGWGRRQE